MHFEQENGRKPHFSPFLALNGPFLGQQFFSTLSPQLAARYHNPHHNVHNRQKLMHFEQENGLKPHFGPFLALIGPILGPTNFFSAL